MDIAFVVAEFPACSKGLQDVVEPGQCQICMSGQNLLSKSVKSFALRADLLCQQSRGPQRERKAIEANGMVVV
jgi:hypothetical protein